MRAQDIGIRRAPWRAAIAAALAVGALGATASQASAATLGYDGGTLVYTAAPGETNRTGPYLESTKDGWVRIPVGYGNEFPAVPDGCDDWRDNGGFISCPMPSALRFDLGDGNDSYSSGTDMPANVPVTVDGGAGNDDLDGRDAADTLYGGPGDDDLLGWYGDDVLDGGDGNDTLDGYGGADRLSGGAGDDLLHPDHYEEPSADVVDGGPGTDRLESDYGSRSFNAPPRVIVTSGVGGADDGRPGEGDDIRSVERLTFSDHANVTGTDGPEYVKLHQVGRDSVLIGLGGDDELRGGDGADRIEGGAGADLLDGGFGDDTITGGPGRDRISADLAGGDCGPLWCKYPYGNDVVDARDGEQDSVTCGAGADRVTADAIDVVAGDCETVDRGAAATTGPGTTTGSGATNAGGKGAGSSVTVAALSGQKLRAALRKGLKVRLAGLPARRTVAVTARVGKRKVAAGRARTDARGAATVTVKFTRAARRSLARKRSVKLELTAGGVRRTVTLKR